jgi:hypothetical protein
MQQQMIAIAYLGRQHTKFHADVAMLIFNIHLFGSPVSSLMELCNGSDSECASNFVQILEKV